MEKSESVVAGEETPARIYLVEGDGAKRLVLATTPHQAIGYCVRKKFSASVPKPRQLKSLLDEKLIVEDATDKPRKVAA